MRSGRGDRSRHGLRARRARHRRASRSCHFANALAARFFRDALALDPGFCRAYSGLSFSHFQNAFLDLTGDRERQVELALDTASQSLASDDRDPAAHRAMGRALWLSGKTAESCTELERSFELSPNFALGHYTLGFRAQPIG